MKQVVRQEYIDRIISGLQEDKLVLLTGSETGWKDNFDVTGRKRIVNEEFFARKYGRLVW